MSGCCTVMEKRTDIFSENTLNKGQIRIKVLMLIQLRLRLQPFIKTGEISS